jgi:hypothetical protein
VADAIRRRPDGPAPSASSGWRAGGSLTSVQIVTASPVEPRELDEEARRGRRRHRTHAVVEGQSTAICGATGHGSYYLRRPFWHPVAAAEPTCRRCLRLLPKARERARALAPVEPPRPGAALELTCAWFRRLPVAFGRPDFPGYKLRLAGEDTFVELARLAWMTLGMDGVRLRDTYYPDEPGRVELEEQPWQFTLPGGRLVVDSPAGADWPEELLVPPDAAVSATLGRGEHLDFGWGAGGVYRAMLRVDR